MLAAWPAHMLFILQHNTCELPCNTRWYRQYISIATVPDCMCSTYPIQQNSVSNNSSIEIWHLLQLHSLQYLAIYSYTRVYTQKIQRGPMWKTSLQYIASTYKCNWFFPCPLSISETALIIFHYPDSVFKATRYMPQNDYTQVDNVPYLIDPVT